MLRKLKEKLKKRENYEIRQRRNRNYRRREIGRPRLIQSASASNTIFIFISFFRNYGILCDAQAFSPAQEDGVGRWVQPCKVPIKCNGKILINYNRVYVFTRGNTVPLITLFWINDYLPSNVWWINVGPSMFHEAKLPTCHSRSQITILKYWIVFHSLGM